MIGGKAASLLTLARIGAAVPPAFVLTTEAYRYWQKGNRGDVRKLVSEGIAGLEAQTGRQLGAAPDGLIVSVRSGAPVSMPGMMDTVLNAGIGSLGEGQPPYLYEARARFLLQFAELVLMVDDEILAALRAAPFPTTAAAVDSLERTLRNAAEFWPERPEDELVAAVEAVFASWQSDRAKLYRRMRKIDDALGTAVTIQQMVFGNRDSASGSGVAFTRDPTSGAPGLMGEFIFGGQGEEVVAGRETGSGLGQWKQKQSDGFAALEALGQCLEAETRQVHEIEFTMEAGRLFVLQCRPALLTARGAARVAVDMVAERRIGRDEALAYARGHGFDPAADAEAPCVAPDVVAIAKGLPVGGGVAAGRLAFSVSAAETIIGAGDPVLFATKETSPALLSIMQRSAALLTMTGGVTSHAAVVARELGIPCVVGLGATIADGTLAVGGGIAEGGWLTLDSDSGAIFEGNVTQMVSRLSDHERMLRGWHSDASVGKRA